MTDYNRIARVIEYLDDHHLDQPSLDALASKAGLSPFHFHKLFSKWAGITPKDFLQALTLQHAKQLLAQGESVLGAALDAGLSGPGRLHDLCVALDAASPGEIKSAGAGWTIRAGFAESPFGICLIAQSPRGICHLAFVDGGMGTEKRAWADLQADWKQARLCRDDKAAQEMAESIFRRELPAPCQPALRAFVKGTEFQVRVWRALLQVPMGRFVSYSRLAAFIGMPSASRAVGSAIGQNTLAFLIPCHRVIRGTGIFGDYRWGATRKRAIAAWESAAVFAKQSAR